MVNEGLKNLELRDCNRRIVFPLARRRIRPPVRASVIQPEFLGFYGFQMRDENCRVVLFFCEQQATQGNSRHRESKKSWFFVYSSPFFIVLFFWHALASLFLLSFPEFRKMLKMSSFFSACQGLKKSFTPNNFQKCFFILVIVK